VAQYEEVLGLLRYALEMALCMVHAADRQLAEDVAKPGAKVWLPRTQIRSLLHCSRCVVCADMSRVAGAVLMVASACVRACGREVCAGIADQLESHQPQVQTPLETVKDLSHTLQERLAHFRGQVMRLEEGQARGTGFM
jgi:hypothetical protein